MALHTWTRQKIRDDTDDDKYDDDDDDDDSNDDNDDENKIVISSIKPLSMFHAEQVQAS